LPLRRLRQPQTEVRARADPQRAAQAHARRGAGDGARRARRDRRGPMAHLLALSDYWWGWGNLLFRWLHVVAAIAWIGSSFYFIALDKHLRPPAEEHDAARGVAGEVWEIHGGGFYRIEKFKRAPHVLPEPLYWFKWEAYTTWLSGFALFVVVYFVHPQTYLVDPSVANLSSWAAIVLAVGGLVLAWLVYDIACRAFGTDERLIAIVV